MTTLSSLFIAATFGIVFLYTFLPWLISRSPLPWLAQCLLVIATITPLLVIEAGDLVLVFLVSSLMTVGLSHVHQRLKERYFSLSVIEPEKFRWTVNLRSLLSGLIIICAITALVVRAIENSPAKNGAGYETPHPAQLLGIGLAMGFWCHSIFFLCLFRPAWKRTFPFLLAALLSSLVAASWNELALAQSIVTAFWIFLPSSTENEIIRMISAPRLEQPGVTMTWLVLLAVNACLVTLGAWSLGMVFSTSRPTSTDRPSRPRKLLRTTCLMTTVLGGASLMTPVVYFYVSLLPMASDLKPHHEYLSGQPNGITELWEVGKELDQSAILNGFAPILPGPELQSEIAAYSGSFEKIDAGLARPNCTWIDWSTGEMFRPEESALFPMDALGVTELRDVARGLRMRSLQAQADGRFDDAIADGMRSLGVAKSLALDPTGVASLVGNAIETIALEMIQPAIEQAGDAQLHASANSLAELAANFESVEQEFAQIELNEKKYVWRRNHWKGRLAFLVFDSDGSNEAIIESLVHRDVCRSLLRTEIAAELYRRDVGRYPPDLATLVPTYLPKIPVDLFFPADPHPPLRYQASPDGSTFRLYSVGVNRLDENGICHPNIAYDAGDIDLALLYGDRLEQNRQAVERFERSQAEGTEDWYLDKESKEKPDDEIIEAEDNDGEEDAGLDKLQR